MQRPYAPFRHNLDGAEHARAFRVTDAGTNNVSVAAGRVRIDQTVTNYATATTLGPLANGAHSVYIDNDGNITSIPGGTYPYQSIPLALVAVVGGVITAILDHRSLFALEVAVSIIDRDLATVTVASTLIETTIYSHTLPAEILGTTGGLRLTIGGDLLKNAFGTFTLRVKLGATTVLTSNAHTFTSDAATRKHRLVIEGMNSAAAAQKWVAEFQASRGGTNFPISETDQAFNASHGVGYNASAEDTSGALLLAVTVQWSAANANLSFRKEMAILELIPPA